MRKRVPALLLALLMLCGCGAKEDAHPQWAALSAALQLVWWAAMFLLLPWTAFVVPVLGVWYILFVALHIIYPALDGNFRVEEQIMEKFPERLGD